jgi:PAS domain S-box-containing protein
VTNGQSEETLLQRIRHLESEIRELERARDALRKSEVRTREVEHLARLGYWELDLATDELHWSDEIYRMFRIERQEFGATYRAFLNRVHPDDREFVDNAYQESLRNRGGYDIVHRLLLPDGSVRYVNEKCKTEYDASGKPLRSLGTVQDITDSVRARQRFAGIVGGDDKMKEVYESIRELSGVNVPVLIQGESGTGKELVAAAIHDRGPRARKPFVPVNCSALPEGVLESELFGHVRGAFTGAIRDKKGRFELADGGTLFLDEVPDLPPLVQVKLLRVLQEGEFERVGGEKTISVNVRIISAANRDLRAEVEAGRFRADLFYRLRVVPVFLPPLRERKDDIPLLVEHFSEMVAFEGFHSNGMSEEALSALMDYSWPGNVRELQSALRFALIKAHGATISPKHLPPEIRSHPAVPLKRGRGPSSSSLAYSVPPGAPPGNAGKDKPGRVKLDRESVARAIRDNGGNKTAAARSLGVGRATLYRFLKQMPP